MRYVIVTIQLTILLMAFTGFAGAADNPPTYFSVQILSNKKVSGGEKAYLRAYKLFSKQTDNIRLEQIGSYYVVRLGAFTQKKEAQTLRKSVVPTFRHAKVVEAYLIPERVLMASVSQDSSPDQSAAQQQIPVVDVQSKDESNSTATTIPATAGNAAVSSAAQLSASTTPAPRPSLDALQHPDEVTPSSPYDTQKNAQTLTTNASPKAAGTVVTADLNQQPVSVASSDNGQQQKAAQSSDQTNTAPTATASGTTPAESAQAEPSMLSGAVDATLSFLPTLFIALLCPLALFVAIKQILPKRQAPADCEYCVLHDAHPGKLTPELEEALEKNFSQSLQIEENLIGLKQDIKTICIASCFRGEGKTFSALSIAHALTFSSQAKVLLIDGSVTAPTLHSLFGFAKEPGLVDVLDGEQHPANVIHQTEYSGLSLMPVGKDTTPASLIPERVQELLTELGQEYKYIVFDGPSLLSTQNASLFAANFDGTLLVVEAEKTKWEVVQMNREKIARVGGKLLGVVLNKRHFYIPRSLYGKI